MVLRLVVPRSARRLGGWLLVALSLSWPALAQRPRVENFTVGDGLPSARIFDLAQGADGRLWILTRAGITLFDGRSFTSHRGTGLNIGELGALEVDRQGRVWTTTRWTGPYVFHLDPDGERWHGLPAPAPDARPISGVADLAVAGTEPVVAVGSLGQGLWIWDGGSWRHLREADGLPADTVGAVEALGERLAVGTAGGLCMSDGRGLDCSPRRREPRLARPIVALGAASGAAAEDRLWVLAADWLGYLEGDRLTVIEDGLSVPDTLSGSVAADAAGGVYFGTWERGFFFSPPAGSGSMQKTLSTSRLRSLSVQHGLAGRETNRGAGPGS